MDLAQAALPSASQPISGPPVPPPECGSLQPDGPHIAPPGAYPINSIILGETGSAILELKVRADGTVGDALIFRSSGYSRLDQASLETAKQWRYKPMTKNGIAVEACTRVSVTWKLEDGGMPPGAPITMMDADAAAYPPESLAAKEEGITCLMVVIDADGTVPAAIVVRSSGHPRLDQATIAMATGRWHFTPAARDGKPIKTMVLLFVTWRLLPSH